MGIILTSIISPKVIVGGMIIVFLIGLFAGPKGTSGSSKGGSNKHMDFHPADTMKGKDKRRR